MPESQTTPMFKEEDSLKIGQRIREREDQESKKDSDSNHFTRRRGDCRIQSLESIKTGQFQDVVRNEADYCGLMGECIRENKNKEYGQCLQEGWLRREA